MPISQALAPAGQEPPVTDPMERVRQALAAKPDGVIEAIAREVGVSTLAVLEAAPEEQRRFIPAERFEALWLELSS